MIIGQSRRVSLDAKDAPSIGRSSLISSSTFHLPPSSLPCREAIPSAVEFPSPSGAVPFFLSSRPSFLSSAMARGAASASSQKTTATDTPPSALKRSTPSTQNMKNQKSILGFFQKSSPTTPAASNNAAGLASSPAQRASEQRTTSVPTSSKEASKHSAKENAFEISQNATPPQSSGNAELEEDDDSVLPKVSFYRSPTCVVPCLCC